MIRTPSNEIAPPTNERADGRNERSRVLGERKRKRGWTKIGCAAAGVSTCADDAGCLCRRAGSWVQRRTGLEARRDTDQSVAVVEALAGCSNQTNRREADSLRFSGESRAVVRTSRIHAATIMPVSTDAQPENAARLSSDSPLV
jgi:hypothetical protein